MTESPKMPFEDEFMKLGPRADVGRSGAALGAGMGQLAGAMFLGMLKRVWPLLLASALVSAAGIAGLVWLVAKILGH